MPDIRTYTFAVEGLPWVLPPSEIRWAATRANAPSVVVPQLWKTCPQFDPLKSKYVMAPPSGQKQEVGRSHNSVCSCLDWSSHVLSSHFFLLVRMVLYFWQFVHVINLALLWEMCIPIIVPEATLFRRFRGCGRDREEGLSEVCLYNTEHHSSFPGLYIFWTKFQKLFFLWYACVLYFKGDFLHLCGKFGISNIIHRHSMNQEVP